MRAVDRVLQIPPQPWVVGWWQDGVGAAASRGTAVLVAHLDSRTYGTGPFAQLVALRIGDRATIADGSGARHDYVVHSVQTYLKASLPWATLFDQAGPSRVVLVTCGGTYRAEAGGWDSNVVATFVPA